MHDVRRLRIFVEVADRGSLAGAAAALSYTPSAVSQHVAALERELDAEVLRRTGRGSELTDAGRALLPHARAVLDRLGRAEAEVRALSRHDATLRVASFASAELVLMPHAVAELRRGGAPTRLAAIQAEPAHALQLLRAGGADCALVYDYGAHGAGPQPGDDLDRLRLFADQVALVVPRRDRLAGRSAVRVSELREASWISSTTTGPCGMMLKAMCADAGFVPRIGYETDSVHVMQEMVAREIGVAVLPSLLLTRLRADLAVLSPRDPAPRRNVWLVWPRATRRSPHLAAARRALQSAAAALAHRDAGVALAAAS